MTISKERFAKLLDQLDVSYSCDEDFEFILKKNDFRVKYCFEVDEDTNSIIAKSVCHQKIDQNNLLKVGDFCQEWHRDWRKPKVFYYGEALFCDWTWDLPENVDDQYLLETVIQSFVYISEDCYTKAKEEGIFG